MPNVMAALWNIGGALCSTSQSLARAHCSSAMQKYCQDAKPVEMCRGAPNSPTDLSRLIAARVFKCSYDNAKRKFYRAFNAIFGKVGRTASEEVIIQLFKSKCLPVLYYGLEACPVNRDQVRSLDYVIHSCFRKIFATTDQSVVEQCMLYFECHHVQDTMGDRRRGFLYKFRMLQNQLCMAFNDRATADLELR